MPTIMLRAIRNPALRTRISMATSALRPATLTQQATQTLICDTLAHIMDRPSAACQPDRLPAPRR